MLKLLRNTLFSQFIWGLMGFYLLNISIDTSDFHLFNSIKNQVYNDQESFVELVTEKILGFENAIAEYDGHERDEQDKAKRFKLDTHYLPFSLSVFSFPEFVLAINSLQKDESVATGYLSYCNPPPERDLRS